MIRQNKKKIFFNINVGVCSTDLFITQGKIDCGPGPIVLGQEISGKVHATGSDVTEVIQGENVVINPYNSCSTCRSV